MAGDSMLAKIGARAIATGVGTNAGVTVTQAAPGANLKLCAITLYASGDAAALVTIESPANTVLWRLRFAGPFSFEADLPVGSVVGSTNAAMLAKISASTSNCEANLITGQMTA